MKYIFILFFLFWIKNVNSIVFFTGCDPNCICDYKGSSLVFKCYSTFQKDFFLPDIFPLIQNASSITITGSFLPNFPSNICQFSTLLSFIDLSDNLIAQNITRNTFGCLNNLRYLNLSKNFISNIDQNSFNDLINLKLLDLSYNQIVAIEPNLFYFKLPSLSILNLNNNRIEEIDIWFLTLSSINQIYLRFNLISRFVNRQNWNPNLTPFNFSRNIEIIDLSFNNLVGFDDDVLGLYSVCTQREFNIFFNLTKKLLLTNNNLSCNCQRSFNLLSFYQNFISSNAVNIRDLLIINQCSSPIELFGQSLLTFADPSTCSASSNIFATNCRQNTSVLVVGNLLEEPKSSLNETDLSYFNDAQIAGYVIGLVGVLALFLFLIYCVCPIEILATCFNCIPCFYSICPCKSGSRKLKEFDLFISYNRTNEHWLHQKLIPFIKERELVENYILHYNTGNRNKEIFGSYTKDIMSRSSCILFILSDAFLIKEWNNAEFRQHLRLLITKEKTKFIVIQMHDICDEEVDEYFTDKLQISQFVSLEHDEFFFWDKLAYFLYTNNTMPPVKRSNRVTDFDDFVIGTDRSSQRKRYPSEISSFSSIDSPTQKNIYQKKTSSKGNKKNSKKNRPVFSPDRKPISYSSFKFKHEII